MGLSPNCLVPAPMYPDSSATLLLIPHFILLQFIPGVFTRTWSLPTGGYWRITQADSIHHLTTTPLVMKNQGIRIKGNGNGNGTGLADGFLIVAHAHETQSYLKPTVKEGSKQCRHNCN